jgi:hypothetical protein
MSETTTTTDTVTVIFHPQAWQNDYAIPVDPEGETEFQVEASAIEGLQDDTYESDDLRFHRNAPEWIKEWSGPFYVEIQRKDEW